MKTLIFLMMFVVGCTEESSVTPMTAPVCEVPITVPIEPSPSDPESLEVTLMATALVTQIWVQLNGSLRPTPFYEVEYTVMWEPVQSAQGYIVWVDGVDVYYNDDVWVDGQDIAFADNSTLKGYVEVVRYPDDGRFALTDTEVLQMNWIEIGVQEYNGPITYVTAWELL